LSPLLHPDLVTIKYRRSPTHLALHLFSLHKPDQTVLRPHATPSQALHARLQGLRPGFEPHVSLGTDGSDMQFTASSLGTIRTTGHPAVVPMLSSTLTQFIMTVNSRSAEKVLIAQPYTSRRVSQLDICDIERERKPNVD